MTTDVHQMIATSFGGSLAETGRQPSIISPSLVGLMRRAALTGALITAAGAAALGYAHWESKRPVLRRMSAPITPREGFDRISILHVSDLHVYPGQNFIAPFLKEVADSEQIDLVVSTGDNLGHAKCLPELFEAYEPLLKYPGAFVLGSNDYYSPLNKPWLSYLDTETKHASAERALRNSPDLPWIEMVNHFQEAGWVDLSNRADSLNLQPGNREVALIGVDDPHIRRDRMPMPPASWLNPSSIRVGLTHSPYRRVLNAMARERADIIFAGHTHGGQVRIPGIGALVTNSDIPRRYASGLHPWGEGDSATWLHVSAGLGTSPYAPIRFACRPEVSLIELYNPDA